MSTSISRRVVNRRVETVQLITFRVQQERFALPIQLAYRVIPLGQIYGDPQGNGISLTHYQDQQIPVIDIQRRVFQQPPNRKILPDPEQSLPFDSQHYPHLLIVQVASEERFGIPLDAPPLLRRVSRSAFQPLPSAYLLEGNIRCVSALVVLDGNESPLFLLNLEQLLQPQCLLSSQNDVS